MALREAAVRRGLHVSEYGVLDDATGETHRCATEEEVYALLGLPWIPPELRENRGELALRDGEVPALIEQGDLKGDLHMHTTLSDGRADAEAMAVRARELGLEYIAITDHSATHGFGNHVTARRAARADRGDPRARRAPRRHPRPRRHRDEHRHRRHRPTTTTSCWRSSTGSIGSVHTSFAIGERGDDRAHDHRDRASADRRDRPPDRAQDRVARPLRDRRRRASSRRPRGPGTMLEINSAPDRRDLDDVHARAAAAAGVRILIDSDAHGPQHADPHALGRRHRPPRLADQGRRREHAALEAVLSAQAARKRVAREVGSLRRRHA